MHLCVVFYLISSTAVIPASVCRSVKITVVPSLTYDKRMEKKSSGLNSITKNLLATTTLYTQPSFPVRLNDKKPILSMAISRGVDILPPRKYTGPH